MNGSIETVNATLQTSMPLSSWLPLHSAAGAFREECSSLEQFTQELFADLERLGGELEAKADELEESRRHLADRGRQLAEQRKESARMSHQLEQQETLLSESLAELRHLRAELANRPETVAAPDFTPELNGLRHQITELQVERATLLERLKAAENQASQSRNGEPTTPPVAVLSADSLQGLSDRFAEQFSLLQEQLAASQPNPTTAAELEILKQELLQQQESQLMLALAELRAMQAEFVHRPEAAPAPQEDLQSLTAQFSQQFVALHERIQNLQPNPPEVTQAE